MIATSSISMTQVKHFFEACLKAGRTAGVEWCFDDLDERADFM
jgi:hypothetical protein